MLELLNYTARFDSDILEGQYWRSTFPRTTKRYYSNAWGLYHDEKNVIDM